MGRERIDTIGIDLRREFGELKVYVSVETDKRVYVSEILRTYEQIKEENSENPEIDFRDIYKENAYRDGKKVCRHYKEFIFVFYL